MKFKFDKFITDITKREKENSDSLKRVLEENEENPQRDRNKLYRERWQNSIRYIRRQK